MSSGIRTGWIGDLNDLVAALEKAGADKNGDGDFMVFNEELSAGADGTVVVHANCKCLVDGKPRDVAEIAKDSGKGQSVVVM